MVDVGLTMLTMAVTLGYMYALYLLVCLLLLFSAVLVPVGGGVILLFFLLAGVFGYMACGLVIGTTLEVVRSGFKAVFVCFVQVKKRFLQMFCW